MCQHVLWVWHDGGLQCPPTAYECSEPFGMCLEKIWESFNVGLEPQPLQPAIASIPGANWKLRRNPNLCQQVLWRWHDDESQCPYTAYEWSQTLFICIGLTWESFNVGLEPQPLHHGIICISRCELGLWPKSKICASRCCEYGMMMDYSAHPQHMYVLNHLEYVWRRCENHLMWVWSFNHCNMTLFQFQVRTGNFAETQNLCQQGLW